MIDEFDEKAVREAALEIVQHHCGSSCLQLALQSFHQGARWQHEQLLLKIQELKSENADFRKVIEYYANTDTWWFSEGAGEYERAEAVGDLSPVPGCKAMGGKRAREVLALKGKK